MWRAVLILLLLAVPAFAEEPFPKKVAAVVTLYRQNSHADVIVSRLLKTQTLDGRGRRPRMQLVSVYTDQCPSSDISRTLAREHGFAIHDTVREALTLGTDSLAVDGVLLVAEHGKYSDSDTGQTVYPKRRLFGEIADVFRQSGRSVPVFCDKHLADNWQDAKWLYDTARELKCPLMAGSSLPSTWRVPEVDVETGQKLREIVAVSYGPLDAYGFHAVEMVQCLAERRSGGETGVRSVQCLTGDAVWKAEAEGHYDRELLESALSRMRLRPIAQGSPWRERVRQPVLFAVEYSDGFRANVLTLNGAVAEFASAWRYEDGKSESALFRLDEDRPFMHFAWLVDGIDHLMHEGQSPWPVERTLLSSGILDAALTSKRDGSRLVETPWLNVNYAPRWKWAMPE